MAQTLFASNSTPSLPLLDANFNDSYGLANLFTTPTYVGTGSKFTLDAAGNFVMTGTADFSLVDTRLVKWGAGSAYVAGSAAGAYVAFGTAGVERARFDSTGTFLVGTTSSTPNPGFAANGLGQFACGNSAAPTGFTFANFIRSGASVGTISQSGTTAVLYNTTSDARLKRNIVDAAEAGSIIDAIKVRSFDWNGVDDEHVEHGFVAQELATVVPQAVKVGDSGAEILDPWAVDPSKLVAHLIREVQSLRVRMALIEAR